MKMKSETRRLTVGLIGAILAVPTAVAALAFRVALAAGAALVLRTGQGVQGRTRRLIGAVGALRSAVAAHRAVVARLVAEELVRSAVAGLESVGGYIYVVGMRCVDGCVWCGVCGSKKERQESGMIMVMLWPQRLLSS